MTDIIEGIYFDMPEDVYHSLAALSCSGIKQLLISPLNYWHQNLNPERELSEETYPQRLGKAIHARLLEPSAYAARYAIELAKADFPDVLETIDDMKAFCDSNGIASTFKRKQDLIDRLTQHGHSALLWDVIKSQHAAEHEGKVFLTAKEGNLISRLASTATSDPTVAPILSGGMPEVSFVVRDPETGILLKARMDYVRPASTIDLKTFSNSRGKPTDRVVFDAIYYENYHLQTAFYQNVRELARRQLVAGNIQTFGDVSEIWLDAFTSATAPAFAFLFIESSDPFDMRLITMHIAESPDGQPNVYWQHAQNQINDATYTYLHYTTHYKDRPWRDPVKAHALLDTDIPQLAFA